MESALIKRMQPMLTGEALEEALAILPEYDTQILNQDVATRLVALNDIYRVLLTKQ
jgi:hypothetical protein